MRDLRPNLTELWRRKANLPATVGSRCIGFMAAHGQAGTTSVAASFAMKAAVHAPRAAWLVDADFQNAAYDGMQAGCFHGMTLSARPYDASFNLDPLYALSAGVSGQGSHRAPSTFRKGLAAHALEDTNLLVTRFRREFLQSDQSVELVFQPAWWTALRRMAEWIVVDLPALDRSRAALTSLKLLDGVVLVVDADRTTQEQLDNLRETVEAHGARVTGIVVNYLQNDAYLAAKMRAR